MQKHILLVTFLALGCAAAPLGAQTPPSGYSGFVGAGASSVRTGSLNDQLAAGGYPTFGDGGPALSLAAYRLLRSGVMLGGEWHFISVGDGEYQGRDVGLGAGYVTVGVAYAFEPSSRARLYPRLGLGVGGMGLWRETAVPGSAVGFDDWLAAPDSDPELATLSQASMVVDLGAGGELALRRSGHGGPIVGLRVGYVATPFDQGWTSDGRAVTGGPRTTVAGPYVRMLLGWRRERVR
jgi:hypothetical protein